MKIKQFTNLASFKASSRINNVTKAIAISSLAMGVAAMTPTAPSYAVVLTGGELTFTGGTTNLSSLVNPMAPASFAVDFNQPAPLPTVLASTGDLAAFFPQSKPALVSATATPSSFSLLSVTPSSFLYQLDNTLAFNFGNISLNVGQNSTFRGAYNNIGGVDFNLLDGGVGSSFITASDSVSTPIRTLGFSFGDTGLSGIGTYRISASPTAVPEPFTVIGTLVGGVAALRMRKKLADASKN
jgi:hypothetical protein